MIRIQRVEQQGKICIAVFVPYDEQAIEKIKQIPLRRWDSALKCWLIPYDKGAYQQLKALFPSITIIDKEQVIAQKEPFVPISSTSIKPVLQAAGQKASLPQDLNPFESVNQNEVSTVKIAFTGKKIILQLKKQETDIRFLRSLHYARWDKGTFSWLVTQTPINQDLIYRYFGPRLQKIDLDLPQEVSASVLSTAEVSKGKAIEKQALEQESSTSRKANKREPSMPAPFPVVDKNTLIVVHYKQGRVRLIFRFEPSLVTLIKSFPFYNWDADNKWWSVALSSMVMSSLQGYCECHGWVLERNKMNGRHYLPSEKRPKSSLISVRYRKHS